MNAMTELKNLRIPFTPAGLEPLKLRQLDVEYDPETKSLWNYMNPSGTACFNLGLLQDARVNDRAIEQCQGRTYFEGEISSIDYAVIASRTSHVFNYGGDLALFVLLIKSRDREALRHYAKLCVDAIYARVANFNSSLLTISLVQGDALGGGFELALTSNVIIAEESARMGFPEILFNLFPGMGAYSLLARKLGMKRAEDMILGGWIYGAKELYEMGVIDVLVPSGEGENATYSFMRENRKRINGMRAMYQCRQQAQTVSYEELMNITEIWVDAALRLTDRDLKMMGRLVRAQMRQQDLRKQGLPIEDDSNWAAEG